MNLLDQIKRDNDVFLNTSEFGEVKDIDGKMVGCVLGTDADGNFSGGIEGGVCLVTKKLRVREGDLAKRPVYGKVMMINGEPYTVEDISHEIGMICITLTEGSPT